MAKPKPTSPIKSSTQHFIEIEDVRDDILLMKDHSAVIVIEIGAVNFWLLSQEEQASMVYAYGNLLNSLSFPAQILILSKKMDISSYIEYLNLKITVTHNDLMKRRLIGYQDFIKAIVKKNTVLEKRFFCMVPFSPLELGVQGIKGQSIKKEYIIARAKTSLYPKRDHLLRLLAKVGLRATVMEKQELVDLFYNLYNPSSVGKQLAPVDSYTDVVLSSQ